MVESQQKNTVEAKKENSSPTPVASGAVVVDSDQAQIDFAGIKALSRNDVKPDPWYRRFGQGLLDLLIRILLFIFGIVLDVLKALVQVVVLFISGIVKGVAALGRYFRKIWRIFREVDGYGKANFFIHGVGYLPTKQYGNFFIFLGVEVLFIVYMAFIGVPGLYNFFMLGESSFGRELDNDSSIRFMLVGIFTILIIGGFLWVWARDIQGGYDNYQIRHLYEYRQAHEDAVHAVEHPEDFQENLTELSHGQIRHLMRNEYGYSELSARIISYVDFRRIPDRKPNIFLQGWMNFYHWFYHGYDVCRTAIRNSLWSGLFAKYLDWEPHIFKKTSGLAYIRDNTRGELAKFHHTYDKYNDFLPYTRDLKTTLEVLHNPELLLEAAYAEDEVSKHNGLAVIPHETPLKYKEVSSRIVGLFECPLEIANKVAKIVVKAVKTASDPSKPSAIDSLKKTRDDLQATYDAFVKKNDTERRARVLGLQRAYNEFKVVAPQYLNGRTAFIKFVVVHYGTDIEEGEQLYSDYCIAFKHGASDAEAEAYLKLAGKHYADYVGRYDESPFHPQPLTFKKQVKQYGDEKFAVTVLALPTIGALITVIIPLVFSILVAFTNWDTADHGFNNFDWDFWKGFGALLNFSSGSLMAKTFVTLLVWTIVWAFFATFLNYIFGIILALLINKKGIKGKKIFRTCFVISIAIPQFITLLAMAKLLGDAGPVNAWMQSGVHTVLHGTGTVADPYYVTGDAGFLGWLSTIRDSQGNSLVSGFSVVYNTLADGTTVPLSYVSEKSYVGFLTNSQFLSFSNNLLVAKGILPKITIIIVNCWVGIPYTMLSTSGILMNIPEDLYESSRIDGASPWTQFWKITMPYVLFVTGPSLLTTFIGNINNFNVIYFLTGGGPDAQLAIQTPAGHTDLLITWLYKLTVTASNKQYYLASAIGVIVFIICAFFSLIMYARMGSTQNEEEFQ
jgi:arabinogalactan oligomer / maltooligosaccharide transport system permease protein